MTVGQSTVSPSTFSVELGKVMKMWMDRTINMDQIVLSRNLDRRVTLPVAGESGSKAGEATRELNILVTERGTSLIEAGGELPAQLANEDL